MSEETKYARLERASFKTLIALALLALLHKPLYAIALELWCVAYGIFM